MMPESLRLHLVSGFLGSGKTTAIVNACRALVRQGKRVGVITNDQGKYLVDTAFVRLENFPVVEVGGGCFCCHFTDLNQQLDAMLEAARPEVIFAESVGSCADLVATVVKPMLQVRRGGVVPTSFSTFVDARLLRMRLNNTPLPFSDGVVYIFDKQIEETRLLVVNKMDLLEEQQRAELLRRVQAACPEKVILPQVSLEEDGVAQWLRTIEHGALPQPDQSLQIDYRRYGKGEARLGWLDEVLEISTPQGDGGEAACAVMLAIHRSIRAAGAPIGHLKFVVWGSDFGEAKVSVTAADEPGGEFALPPLAGSRVTLLVNARVEMPADLLETCVNNAVAESAATLGLTWTKRIQDQFHPGFPRPTYRFV